ncbi:MAG: acyl-CoA thioesterase [Polyangiaceae bacterium]|jgi:acyl-CoA thioesterase
MTHFSQLLSSAREVDGVWRTAVPDDWMQGRSVFGGLQGALAAQAMRSCVAPEVPLRVLQMTFIAPAARGDLDVRPQMLRAGKSATHVEARVSSGGALASIAVGVFGRARPSHVEVVPRVAAVPPEEARRASPVAAPHINFTQHFKMRWLRGDPPFSGTSVPRAVIEVGLNDRGVTSTEHVIAIADAIPPLALSLLKAPAPGSTLTWTLEMLKDTFDDVPLDGWVHHAELTAGRDGYTNQSVFVCARDGSVAALSRQSMVVFG